MCLKYTEMSCLEKSFLRFSDKPEIRNDDVVPFVLLFLPN